MLETLLENPELARYRVCVEAGQTLFFEGDDSRDLYILVSGQLEVHKGKKIITAITKPGDVCGEMSFLLGECRTSTVKAGTTSTVLCIPGKDVESFLVRFPEVSGEITLLLARRLAHTSTVLQGLKEFADQLPDAVIMTDAQGAVVTWNTASEELFGLGWNEMRLRTAADFFLKPEDFESFFDDVLQGRGVRERVLALRHPAKDSLYVSASTTVLYDGHHNFQGLLCLCRDVSRIIHLERRYRRIRRFIAPALVLVGLLVGTFLFVYPSAVRKQESADATMIALANHLAKDRLVLSSLLDEPLSAGDHNRTFLRIKDFFAVIDPSMLPYDGIVVLDNDKRVFAAYSLDAERQATLVQGSSYAGIEFRKDDGAPHYVLSLYHTDPDNPTGTKGIEIAFEMNKNSSRLGWLVFQMVLDASNKVNGIAEEDLTVLPFKKTKS